MRGHKLCSHHYMNELWTSRHSACHVSLCRKLGDVYGYDLREWRRAQSSSKRGAKDEIAAGLALLDADGGGGLGAALLPHHLQAR